MARFPVRLGLGVRWGFDIARSQPRLALYMAALFLGRTLRASRNSPKILIATHHKVLTVYLGRVFGVFAAASGRSVSTGKGNSVDYTADILIDHHSQFDFSRINGPWVGVHIRRDPRDVIVSCTHYHLISHEAWLHQPRAELNGSTYQEYVRALPTLEDRLLFEIDHSGGYNVRQMLKWCYDREGMSEWRYEDLVRPEGLDEVAFSIREWPLSKLEFHVLIGLFRYFSFWGAGARNNKHIRNPQPSQWKEQFSELVHERFEIAFPGAVERLGYESSIAVKSE